MKNYIQFFHESTGYNHETKDFSGPTLNIPKPGSDGIQYFDGRKRLATVISEIRLPANCTGYIIYLTPPKIWYGVFYNGLKVQE
jgi:hypothetical protein